MSYSLAIRIDAGLVLASDSRTTAGVDNVSTYSKMHAFSAPGRLLVLLSAGNLATTQQVLTRLQTDIADPARSSLFDRHRLFDVAHYVGQVSRAVQAEHADALEKSGATAEVSFILGGQIEDEPHGIFLIYPQGNCISSSPDTPYLQIGEYKYGKPILDRVTSGNLTLEDAARCALVSIDSTMRSNLTVGPPVELAIYRKDELRLAHRLRLGTGSSPFFTAFEAAWQEGIKQAFEALPKFDWETPARAIPCEDQPEQRRQREGS